MLWPFPVLALDPSLDIIQYAHTAWRIREGNITGEVQQIAQTPDGYLWLATDSGLLRFDGARMVPFDPPTGEQLPASDVRGLLVTRDGTLWIGTGKGLSSWRDGKLIRYPELDGFDVATLLEDHEGTIWAGGALWEDLGPGKLCQIEARKTQCYGNDRRFGYGVTALYEDRRRNLWLGTGTGLWRWNPGPPKNYGHPDIGQKLIYPYFPKAFSEGEAGEILMARPHGLWQLVGEKFEPYRLPAGAPQTIEGGKLLRDRDGGLWIGSMGAGLLHVHQGRVDAYVESDGLSGNSVDYLFEDREGNVWVGTTNGLDRFREYAVPTISVGQGLSDETVLCILAARDGSVWLGTRDGLNRWKDGQVTIYRKPNSGTAFERGTDRAASRGGGASYAAAGPSATVHEITDSGLPDNYVFSLAEDTEGRIWVTTHGPVGYLQNGKFAPVNNPSIRPGFFTADNAGNLWLTHNRSGLSRLRGAEVVEHFPWPKLGIQGSFNPLAVDTVNGGVWVGSLAGELVYLKDGQVQASYGHNTGLGTGRLNSLHLDSKGALWAATDGGLSHIQNSHVITLTSKNGLPCDTVLYSEEDDEHALWVLTTCGLARLARTELDAWIADPQRRIQAAVFDASDGVPVRIGFSGATPLTAKAADGKLWFLGRDGALVVDPRHLSSNNLPPPVRIEQVKADGKLYQLRQKMQLSAKVRDLWIAYTALSLVAPERVHFKYMLEGQDREWREVINDREAQYTNLPPGPYRFRVIACNNSGLWNKTGDTLEFSVAPAYYQTNWFRAVFVAAVLGSLWTLYQVRIHQIGQQEKKLREVVETIPVAAFTTLPDGSNTFVSSRWTKFTGLSGEETAGTGWQQAVHPDDLARHSEKWWISVKTGQPFEDEARFRRAADGAYHWFLVRAVPLRNRRGKILSWYGTLTDIEDRKMAEEALRRGEAYLEEAQSLTHTGSWAWDPHRDQMLYCSEEIYRIYGLDPRQGVPAFEELMQRVHPEDRDDVREKTLEGARQKIQHLLDFRIVLADGTTKYIRSVRRPVLNEAGDVVEVVGTSIDVTELKRAEAERERLSQLEADLAHINRVSVMGEMAASISHEISQPLTAIATQAAVCLRWLSIDPPRLAQAQEAAEKIARDSNYAGEVIRRVRALFKRAAVEKVELDLNGVINEALELLSAQIARRHVALKRHLGDIPHVMGDRVQLQQVILNLALNGLEAMDHSSLDGPKELTVRSSRDNAETVVVEIQDSGAGLEDPERIFEPFFTTKTTGTGLGLPICRSIVKAHGGKLWAESNEGPGTIFRFTLPVQHSGAS